MSNVARDVVTAADLAFYKKSGVRVARAHLRPAFDPGRTTRKAVLGVFCSALGDAAQVYPENMDRNFFGGDDYFPADLEKAARLGGALRRFADLAAAASINFCPFAEYGVNSPRNDHVWALQSALVASGYNADAVWYAFQRVTRWTGADWDDALRAIAVSRRPRRAALIIRWHRLGINPGQDATWRQWREAAWRLLATPNRPAGAGNIDPRPGAVVDDDQGRYQLTRGPIIERHGCQLWHAVAANGKTHQVVIRDGLVWVAGFVHDPQDGWVMGDDRRVFNEGTRALIHRQRALREQEQRLVAARERLPGDICVIVTRDDSYDAGNCQPGTAEFIRRHRLRGWYARAEQLLATGNPLAAAAVNVAIRRIEEMAA